jgi:hypothetical protein
MSVWDLLALHDVQKFQVDEVKKSQKVKENQRNMKIILDNQFSNMTNSKRWEKDTLKI